MPTKKNEKGKIGLVLYKGNYYWKGTYDCLIPESLDQCAWKDCCNKLRRDGSITEMKCLSQTTREKWFERHAYEVEPGMYVYKIKQNPEKGG